MTNKVKLNLYSFTAVFFWAAAFPLTKILSPQFSPYCLGLIRCTVASAALLLVGKHLHIRKPANRKDALLLAAAGIAGFSLYLIFFNTGIVTITSATSSIIMASTPIMTAVVCSRLYREKISRIGWLAIFCAFAGVITLLFWNGVFSINVGVVWTLAAAIVFCTYNILNRRLAAAGYTSVEIVTYAMISGAIALLFCLPEAARQVLQAGPPAVLLSIALGLFPSATSYLLWAKALTLADKTNEVTNYMFVTPLLSTIMGFLLLHEVPEIETFIGGAVIIASVVIFSLKGK